MPTLRFPLKDSAQRVHLARAEDELRKAGVSFDTGANVCDGVAITRDWELDWSLRGAKIIEHPPKEK